MYTVELDSLPALIPDIFRQDMVIDKVEQYFDEDIHQELLGYIMDILVKVKRWKEQNRSLNISKIPRMADWARHCEIITRCMGYEPEEFLNAYKRKRQNTN